MTNETVKKTYEQISLLCIDLITANQELVEKNKTLRKRIKELKQKMEEK